MQPFSRAERERQRSLIMMRLRGPGAPRMAREEHAANDVLGFLEAASSNAARIMGSQQPLGWEVKIAPGCFNLAGA
jgi:hypothetical protein